MALLFIDGFKAGDYATKWTGVSGSGAGITSSSPRFAGAYSFSLGSFAGSFWKTVPANAELYFGFAMRLNSGGYSMSLYSESFAVQHLSFTINAGSFMEVRRGSSSGTILGTGSKVIQSAVWHYYEFHIVISDTVGIVQVRIDGASTNDINYSGDTRNAGTVSTFETVYFNTGSGTSGSYFTDFYVLDTTGSSNNTWLGDVRVNTVVPMADGTYSQLTGSDSDQVANWQLVDELPYSSADYTGSPTIGLRDTYTMSDLPANVTTVFGVQSNLIAAKNDAATAYAKTVMHIGASNYYGTAQALTTSYLSYTDMFNVNPATAVSWTVSDVNALDAGMEVA